MPHPGGAVRERLPRSHPEYEIGNASLDEETSLNLDLGYHYHGGRYDLRVDGFINGYEDFICAEVSDSVFNLDLGAVEPVCTADQEEECVQLLNWSAADADFYGVEAQFDVDLGSGLRAGIFGDYVRGEFDQGSNEPAASRGSGQRPARRQLRALNRLQACRDKRYRPHQFGCPAPRAGFCG